MDLDSIAPYATTAAPSAAYSAPHRFLFQTLTVTLNDLDPTDPYERAAQEHYVDLAIFAQNTRLPISVLERLWAPMGYNQEFVANVVQVCGYTDVVQALKSLLGFDG